MAGQGAMDLRDDVLRIYDAVGDPAHWPGVLDRLSHRLGAKGIIIFEQTGIDDRERLHAPLTSSGYHPVILERYLRRYFEIEAEDHAVFEAHSLSSDGIDLIDDTVLVDDPSELGSRPNVKRLRDFGIFHRAAGLLNKDNKAVARFSVQLGIERGPLSVVERESAALLLPHLAKAIDLGRANVQLAATNNAVLAAMDCLAVGVCLLDRLGRVVVQNREFSRQLAATNVFKIAPGGSLRFRRISDQARYEGLKEDALNHGRFGARPRKEAVAADDDGYLCIELVPLATSQEMGTAPFAGFMLYSTDTSRAFVCNTSPMRTVFNLTDTELEILDSIAEGLTNTEIAERRDRSVATINAQVKSILGKTECATRTQLVRLMMSFGVDFLAR
ncbi:MAG: helix-turn-helix transcriptional regulator [Pseudomonadota bacterium]